MKFSKVSALVASLFVVSSVAFAAMSDKTVDFDLRHSVQHIGSEVRIQTTGGTSVASITQQHFKVKVVTAGGNFLLITGNTISEGSLKSNILGGNSNKVGNDIITSMGSTIIAGNDNKNFSDYSIIGGGENNKVYSGRENVIVGGSGNTINEGEHSVILGGIDNRVRGEKSTVVGVNSVVEGNYSMALGSGSNVNADNSFLWTDSGATLGESNVFAVMSEKGMVINTNTAHDLAQLTVGGSIIVGEGTGDNVIQCDAHGKGIIKLVDKVGDQRCLCSCNGFNWDSLLGEGQCKSVCNGLNTVTAICGTELTVLTGDDGLRQYSGSCDSGSVIEGSYFVSTNSVWWACQESNGHVATCSYALGCTGTIPTGGHVNNNLSPNIQYNYYYSPNKGDICSFSCDDGYGYYNSECTQICKDSPSGGACYFGERLLTGGTRTNAYTYACKYNSIEYKCETTCPAGYLWAGDYGALTGCQLATIACSPTTGYVCNLGTAFTGEVDDSNDRKFRRKCVDSNNNTIGTGCELWKPVENRTVYYDKQTVSNGTVISFRLTGAISTGVQVRLQKGGGQSEIFIITGGLVRSDGKLYTQNVSSYSGKFLNGMTTIDVAMPTLVYHLEIVDGGSTPSLCSSTCEYAGGCQNGATSSSFSSGTDGETVTFRWTCTLGSVVDTGCMATCSIKSGNCTSVPTNGTGCDANKNGCTPLRGAAINLRNFYLDGAGHVTSNGSGNKKHCVFNGGKIECTDVANPYTWSGWTCNSGYTMDVGSCACRGGSACNSNIYSGWCTYGSTSLHDATYTSNYTYWCSDSSETCNAKCATGKVWAGEALGCVSSLDLCVDDNSSHSCAYGSNREYLNSYASGHIWKCKLGELSKICHHCSSGYTWNSSLNTCTANSVSCASTGIMLDSVNYSVPSLTHGASTGVAGRNAIKSCTVTASCSNGTTTLGTPNCTMACGSGPSNTPICNIGTDYNKDGSTYKSSYSYYCKDSDGWIFTNKCNMDCISGKYWNGTQCTTAPTVCSGTHYNCIAPGQFVAGSASQHGTVNVVHTWQCSVGDVLGTCTESEDLGFHGCYSTTKDGYELPNLPTQSGHQVQVYKYTDEGKCSAVAVCSSSGSVGQPGYSPYVWKLINETCPSTRACNFMGGCNLGTSWGYDGATYSNTYHYKCDNGDKVWNCTGTCASNKVWNGTQCVTNNGGCVNGSHYTCSGSFAYGTSDVVKGYYWDCKDGDGNKLNGTYKCYECKSGYVYSGTTHNCEGKTLNCGGTAPTHSITGAGTYVYSGTTYNWEKVSTTGTPGFCKYKCATNYNSGNSCAAEIVACNGSYPSSNATLGAANYLYDGTNKSWTGVTYSTLGACQFRCNDGYYASGSTCVSICKAGYDGCNGGYTPSGTKWATSYTCNGYSCNCLNLGSTYRYYSSWPTYKCIDTSVDTCNNSASSPSSNGCKYGLYSGNSYSSGYIWNCVDANGATLNSSVCYKCSNGYSWDSSNNKCIDVCAPDSSEPCNGGYVGEGTNGSSYYTCKKSGSSNVSCSCPSGQTWNGSRCEVPEPVVCTYLGDSYPYLSSVPTNATLYLPNISNGSSIGSCTVNYNQGFSVTPPPASISYNCTYTTFPSSIPGSCTSLNLDTFTGLDTMQWYKIKNSNVTTLSIAGMKSIDTIGWTSIRDSKITTLNLPGIPSIDTIGWTSIKDSKITTLIVPAVESMNTIGWASIRDSNITTLIMPGINMVGAMEMDSIAWSMIRGSKITTLHMPCLTSFNSIEWDMISDSNITTLSLPGITSMDSIAWSMIRGSKITTLSLPGITSMDSIAWSMVRDSNITTLNLPGVTSIDTIGWTYIKDSKLYALSLGLTSKPSGTYVTSRCSSHQ